MTVPPLSFVHRFQPGSNASPPLLLLHGTGGDEADLLPIGALVAPGAALLSPRGQVVENGMPRFFRRLAEGVFDEEDLARRVDDLAGFVTEARARYGLAAPVALGLSNGANVAAAILLARPGVLAGAILLRPMPPFRTPPRPDLGGTPVLVLSGALDPLVPDATARRLVEDLGLAGAAVEHRVLPSGHGLSQADATLARAWFEGRTAG